MQIWAEQISVLRTDAGGWLVPEPKFGPPVRASNSLSPALKVAMLQGIVRSRGHVAPARSLC